MERRTVHHSYRALRHGRGDRGAGAAAGQDARAQTGDDAGVAHREDKAAGLVKSRHPGEGLGQ
jgi:hypothetical protein